MKPQGWPLRLTLTLVAVTLAGWLSPALTAAAQTPTGVTVESNVAQEDFGNAIRFSVRAHSDDPIRSVTLLYELDSSGVQLSSVPAYQPGQSVQARYDWGVAGTLLPGTEVEYRWQFETASGTRTVTPPQKISYEDTRISWLTDHRDQVTVYFQPSDPLAGSLLLDEVSKTQTRMNQQFGLAPDRPIKIYAYARQQDYVYALGQPAYTVTTPAPDRIFVLTGGGATSLSGTLASFRHGYAEAIFLQRTANPYGLPPQWLAEGFKELMGGTELPADAMQKLAEQVKQKQFFRLKTLDQAMPTDQNQIALARAESISAVAFIVDSFGADKLKATLAAFKDGSTVDEALKKGLGLTLDQFEARWESWLVKGTAAASSRSRNADGGAQPATGSRGFLDRMLGPAIEYWQGVFGQNTKYVLIGIVGLMGLGVFVIVGSGVAAIHRQNRDDD